MNGTNYLEKLFRWISDTVNGAERAVLDALSAIVPYTTSSIPAYMTYWHTITYMGFPAEIAWLSAFTVEVLGVTAVSTAIRFWQWNKTHSLEKDHAPFWLSVVTYGFYIMVTLSVNVLLEVHSAVRSPAVIWAIGLFSLLSIPSGVLISIRAQFGEMLEEKREKVQQRKMERQTSRLPISPPAPMVTFSKDADTMHLTEADRNNGGGFRNKRRPVHRKATPTD